MDIKREEESLNIANIYLLVRFKKIRETFPNVTRLLSILLTPALQVQMKKEVILKRVYQRFHVQSRLPAMPKGELSAAISHNNSQNI